MDSSGWDVWLHWMGPTESEVTSLDSDRSNGKDNLREGLLLAGTRIVLAPVGGRLGYKDASTDTPYIVTFIPGLR
jgi:hypothetical protein